MGILFFFNKLFIFLIHFIIFTLLCVLMSGAIITGEDAGFVLPAATRSTHAVTVITTLRYFFLSPSNFLPFCFYLIWVCLVFPIRACWRIPLIATSSFAKMLNKYHNTAFHFLFFCYELGTMSVRLIHFLHLFAVSGCLFSLWHWATCMYFCQFSI